MARDRCWAILLILFEKLMLIYDGEDQSDSALS